MKKRFFPKLFLPTVKFIFTLLFLSILFRAISLFFAEKMYVNTDLLFGAILFIPLFGSFTFNLAYYYCYYFKCVTITDNMISIFELKNLKTTTVNFEEISGYSTSEIFFGKCTWKSKSIVIYFKSGKVSEIVDAYTNNIDELEKELRRKEVKYLGFENFMTDWFYRKYKFSKSQE